MRLFCPTQLGWLSARPGHSPQAFRETLMPFESSHVRLFGKFSDAMPPGTYQVRRSSIERVRKAGNAERQPGRAFASIREAVFREAHIMLMFDS